MTGRRAAYVMEPLDARRLLAAPAPWGAVETLIGLDAARTQYPNVTGAGQCIAVIDTGIDYTNPQLGGAFGPGHKVVGGHDFVDNDEDPIDTYGHGTQVASILAADSFTMDGYTYQGIAPDATLVALRIGGGSGGVPDSTIESALQWVLQHRAEFGITAVNISFGDGHYPDDVALDPYSDELADLAQSGVFIAAASGNTGPLGEDGITTGIQYPAADSNVFSVGAVDVFDVIADFTSRGPTLDILAPGVDVPTVDEGEMFHLASGTSFATPFVTATAAILRQIDPNFLAPDIASILRASGKDNLDGDEEFGDVTGLRFPRLDINRAITLAVSRKSIDASNIPAAQSNDIATDSEGVLHIAYYDSTARTLKYATRSTSGKFSASQIIDGSSLDLGQFVSIAVDHEDRPAIAYFDGGHGDLKFARFNGATWDIQTVDANKSVGLYPSLIFTDSDHALISYYYKSAGDLRLAELDDETWTISTIDSSNDIGRSSSIAQSASGEIAIAYANSTRGSLKIARKLGENFSTSVVDAATRGVSFISLAFDANQHPALSYYDAWPADLKFASFDGAKWHREIIAAKGAQGLYANLLFDNDAANILFYNRKTNSLMRARNASANWVISSLQTNGGRFLDARKQSDNHGFIYTWVDSSSGLLHVDNA